MGYKLNVTPTQIPPDQFDNKSITFKCGNDVLNFWNLNGIHQNIINYHPIFNHVLW